MIAVYRRVSTEDQSTQAQAAEIDRHLAGRPYEVYEDHGVSGSTTSRPALDRLFEDCKAGLISEVVVYKLDRLTRAGAAEAVILVSTLDKLGVAFTSVSQPMFSQGQPFRVPMIAMFGEVAQMERQNIVDRISAGMRAAKDRGVHVGAPRKYDDAMIRRVHELRDRGNSIRTISGLMGISKSHVQRLLTKAA